MARAVATAWLDEIVEANRLGKAHCVALSGGRITLKFFAEVISLAGERKVSLAGVHFFWADERCVPPADPESSFAAANQHFFHPLGIAADHIHRIRGEDAPGKAAEVATADILRIAPRTAAGQPVLDLIFLGMGEDGHVASLFPGEPASAMADKSVYRTIQNSPKPPPNRVTLGYAAIAAARQVWVLASGSGKEEALRESLKPDGQTPLARVLQMRQQRRIFTDIQLPSTAPCGVDAGQSVIDPVPAKPVERLFPFVVKARALIVGRDTLVRSKSRLHFILITDDISENSREQVLKDFSHYPVVQHYTEADIESFFGFKGTKVIGFAKSGLAQSIYAELKQHRINRPVEKPKPPESPPTPPSERKVS